MRTPFRRAIVAASAVFLCCIAPTAPARAQKQTQTQNQKQDRWQAPPEARQLQNPMKGDGRTVERGQKLFDRYCVPCHGTQGAADGTMARKLGYKPANLTVAQMSQLTDGEIFWKISKGRPPMPIFEQQLSQRERWDVVSYVRTLMKSSQ